MHNTPKKMLLCLASTFLLLLCLIKPVMAETTYTNPDTDYSVIIEDDADLLTDSEEEELTTVMKDITVYGGASFVTINENSTTAATFIESYYRNTFGHESGTVFLIDMDNRKIWIFSDGKIYNTVTKSYADTITDNCYTYASNGDYFGCAKTAFSQIVSLLQGRRIAQPMKYISNAFLAVIVALLLNFIIVQIFSKTNSASSKELLSAIDHRYNLMNPDEEFTYTSKEYSPTSSSGGSSGGGGGGGSSSGGGDGHSF